MKQATKIIGTGLATTGSIGARVSSYKTNLDAHVRYTSRLGIIPNVITSSVRPSLDSHIHYSRRMGFIPVLGTRSRSFSNCSPLSVRSNSSVDSEESSFGNINVEESTTRLAEEFKGKPSQFIKRQEDKMETILEQSKTNLQKIVEDRTNARPNVGVSSLEQYDNETKKMLDDENGNYNHKIEMVTSVRDTVLDLTDGLHENSPGSDFESDYDSPTSQTRIDAEYNDLDQKDAERLEYHKTFTDNLKFINNSGNQDLTIQSDTSFNQPLEGSSKKRKHEQSDSEEAVTNLPKIPKTEASSSDNRSPLDYVLDKQQSEGLDFTDDVD